MQKLEGKEAQYVFFISDVMKFKDYISFMEGFLEDEDIKQKDKLEEILSVSNPENLLVLEKSFWTGRTDEFSEILRRSFFINLYSYFENALVNECRSRKNDKIQLVFNDIYASDELQKISKYFTKVLQIDFPNNTPQWEAIQNYRIIRNCIVHAQGRLSEMKNESDKQKILRYFEKTDNLALKKEEIHLQKGFCEEVLKNIETFLDLVLFSDVKL